MFLLPLLCLFVFFLLIYSKTKDVFRAAADAWICFTVVIWGTTEVLSAVRFWISGVYLVLWMGLLLAGIFCLYKRKDQFLVFEELKKCHGNRRRIVTAICLFGVVVLVLAMIRSNSNVDSMLYHLPRIMHWMQNKSVGHYAAAKDLQIRYPVLAEYFVAQILMLGGSDRFANVFQTMAYFLAALMIAGIGKKLGVSFKGRALSAVLFLFMPMAFAQAFTTQTDNLGCLFLLIYLYILLDFIQTEKLSADRKGLLNGAELAASVLFGYLCKPTVCFAMLIFFVWMCMVRIWRKDRISVLLKYVLIGGTVAVILFLPLALKSYQTYYAMPEKLAEEDDVQIVVDENAQELVAQNTLAPDAVNLKNAIKNPIIFIMTCLQNMGRNSTSICFPKWNELIDDVIKKVAEIFEYSVVDFGVQEGKQFFGCDTASNPAVMIFTLLVILCVIFGVSKPNREQMTFFVCTVVSLLTQCGLQGYTSFRIRYLVGILAVLCVAIGIGVDALRVQNETKKGIMVAMVSLAAIGVLNGIGYQLGYTYESVSRETLHQYFIDYDLHESGYEKLLEHINNNGYTRIGIATEFDFEYVLWSRIDNLDRLEAVNVGEPYYVYEDMDYYPDCVMVELKPEEELPQDMDCHGEKYLCTWSGAGEYYQYAVYTRE